MENTITLEQLPDPSTDKELQKITRKSEITHRRWRKKGLLPFHRLGGQIFYTKSDVQEFFERCKEKAFAA